MAATDSFFLLGGVVGRVEAGALVGRLSARVVLVCGRGRVSGGSGDEGQAAKLFERLVNCWAQGQLVGNRKVRCPARFTSSDVGRRAQIFFSELFLTENLQPPPLAQLG